MMGDKRLLCDPYKKYLHNWRNEMDNRYSDKRRIITRRFK